MAKRVEIIKDDFSSLEEKLDKIKNYDFFSRTRWERSTVIDVLDADKDYLDLVGVGKIGVGSYKKSFDEYKNPIEKRFKRNIDNDEFSVVNTTLFTDIQNGRIVFAVVANRVEKEDASLSPNQEYIDSTEENENYLFSSVFLSSANGGMVTSRNTHTQVETLKPIQLFRYDPTGRAHPNREDIRQGWELAYGPEIKDLYKKYFINEAPAPHFHFLNRTNSEHYEKTTGADAISLDNLIEYIFDLMNENGKKHPLNNIDFGMPFLRIKNNPELYLTTVNYKQLKEALINRTVNMQLDSIFKQTQTIKPDQDVVLKGLEAVYSDLIVLKALRELRAQNGGFIKNNSNKLNLTNLKTVKTSLPNKNSNFISAQSSNLLKNGESSGNDGREHATYEVSLAEFQVATKIASGGKLSLKNEFGKDKIHFKEAVDNLNEEMLILDDESCYRFAEILHLCEDEKNKSRRDGDGPSFQ